jgi:aminoglycoside phosphotransferase (APT) family kinase protein
MVSGVAPLHEGEAPTDSELVRRLLADQFPRWADLPLEPVAGSGTDHALYRLGGDLVVRLPRLARAAEQLAKEQRWLPRFAPHLPLTIPTPVADGAPGEGFPHPWAVYRWIEGETAATAPQADPEGDARALAAFIGALQAMDPVGGPAPGAHNVWRGQPIRARDGLMRRTIAALDGEIDTAAALALWEDVMAAGPWAGPPVWLHGDLMPGNLIIDGGRLAAVIDFGCLGVGDPACELMPAWNLFDDAVRRAFRSALAPDDDTWRRARGWALHSVMGIAYYRHTRPAFSQAGRRTVEAVLAEFAGAE